jgi:putative transposase
MEVGMNKRHVQHTRPIDSAQVRRALADTLTTYLSLDIAGRDLDAPMLWDILIHASVQQATIETACTELDGAPSGNTVREHLGQAVGESADHLLELEHRLNRALQAQLPRRFRKGLRDRRYDIAIDLVQIPYHGQPCQNRREIRGGPAKSGTTHFHTYATLAIVHDDQRYELALTFVWSDEALVAVLERLVKQARRLGLQMRRAYLDKGFRGSEILRWLRRHRIRYVIPVPLHGKALLALCTGRHSYRTRYTFNPGTAAAYTTDLVIVCKYSAGRRGQHQVDYLVYAVYGVDAIPELQVHELYRRRFGIESGYRQMHQVRARTTSRNPVVRLLLIGLALLILNVYLALRQIWLTVHRFGSRTRRTWLTLKRLSLMLARLSERLMGVAGIEQVARSQIGVEAFS